MISRVMGGLIKASHQPIKEELKNKKGERYGMIRLKKKGTYIWFSTASLYQLGLVYLSIYL